MNKNNPLLKEKKIQKNILGRDTQLKKLFDKGHTLENWEWEMQILYLSRGFFKLTQFYITGTIITTIFKSKLG